MNQNHSNQGSNINVDQLHGDFYVNNLNKDFDLVYLTNLVKELNRKQKILNIKKELFLAVIALFCLAIFAYFRVKIESSDNDTPFVITLIIGSILAALLYLYELNACNKIINYFNIVTGKFNKNDFVNILMIIESSTTATNKKLFKKISQEITRKTQ